MQGRCVNRTPVSYIRIIIHVFQKNYATFIFFFYLCPSLIDVDNFCRFSVTLEYTLEV